MSHLLNYGQLLYWMTERESVRRKKEAGEPKPWSDDPVFQTTYFCNIRREDDKVTKFIRKMYSPYSRHPLFTHNIILSRFLNWPDTLDHIDYQDVWDPEYLNSRLKERKLLGKVWGNAYVVSTCGRQMDKIDYLTQIVMPSIAMHAGNVLSERCDTVARNLQLIEGISTFMAGQVIADLKNTPGHPLTEAPDWWTFALPGPGSRRGMNWLCGEKISDSQWYSGLASLQTRLYDEGWRLHAQDIQNCLCEFDKFMRVRHGTGRSKRNYYGHRG
jgi:hypothetical protein